jgi:hypothetical protein
MPAPPERLVDAFDAILDTVLIKNSMMHKETLIFDLAFKTSGQASKCMLLLFPSPELQQLLVQKSKIIVGLGLDEQSPEIGTIKP